MLIHILKCFFILFLFQLNNPEAAVRIVKENRSTEGAKLVARFVPNEIVVIVAKNEDVFVERFVLN